MGDRTERVELTNLVMVTDPDGRILVQDRLDPEWGGICFPGGHVEKGESFVRSAIREVYEETGLTIENPSLCGIKQFPIEGGRYLVLLYKADRYSGTLKGSPEGPVFWLHREKLKNYRLSGEFQDIVDLMTDPGKSEMFLYKQDDNWNFDIL